MKQGECSKIWRLKTIERIIKFYITDEKSNKFGRGSIEYTFACNHTHKSQHSTHRLLLHKHKNMSKADYEGFLTKRSMWLKEWRRRYFELRGDTLSFSEGQGKASHGSIDLKDCLTVKSAEEKTKKKYSFEVATPESTYYMYASSEKEKDEWIGAIGRAIVRSSGAFHKKAAEESSSEDDSSDEDE